MQNTVVYNDKKYVKYSADNTLLFKYCGTWQQDEAELQKYIDNYHTGALDYKFETGNFPDLVWIFLGTNDGLKADDINDFSDR